MKLDDLFNGEKLGILWNLRYGHRLTELRWLISTRYSLSVVIAFALARVSLSLPHTL